MGHAHSYANMMGQTALHMAACAGHAEVIQLLVDAAAYVDIPDVDGETPLHYAALAAQTSAAQKLLSLGANPMTESFYSETALEVALQKPAFFIDPLLKERY